MKHVPRQLQTAVLALGVWLVATDFASAGTIYFNNRITDNGSGVSGSQFNAVYEAFGVNQVKITINNTGPSGEVHEVYIDDNELYISPPIAGLQDADQSIGGVFGLAGVDFTQEGLGGATTNPSELPEAGDVGFETTTQLSADRDTGGSGIQSGEYLGILLNLKAGVTFADVEAGFANGSFRIGLHVGGFPDSESFVNTPPETVPEPSSIALAVVGFLGFGASRLRRKRSAKHL